MENGLQQTNQASNADAPENWVDVNPPSQGGDVNAPENWIDASTQSHTESPYEAFKASNSNKGVSDSSMQNKASTGILKPKEGQSDTSFEDLIKSTKMVMDAEPLLKPGERQLKKEDLNKATDFPDHSYLNTFITNPAVLISNQMDRTLFRPITGKPLVDDADAIERLEQKHPIASITSGFAPWIATAPLFPAGLSQFVTLPVATAIGRQRTEASLMETHMQKAGELTKEAVVGATLGRAFQATESINFVKRPFATVLAKAGVITSANTVMHTMYGDDLAQSFKDGALLGALAHIGELPHLGSTVLGRGIIAHANSIYADLAIKKGLPEVKMDPDLPGFPGKVDQVTDALAKQLPNVDKPIVVSAAIKLPDGSHIEGKTHEEAIGKITRPIEDVVIKGESGKRSIVNKEGNEVGTVSYGNEMSEEGFHINVNADMQGKKYGTAAIKQVLDKEGSISGEVGKDNVGAQEFWKKMGAKLIEQPSGNFSMYLNRKDFRSVYYKQGFIVQEPSGESKFITKEESMKEPFNIKDGDPKNVPGLLESRFIKPEEPKITNPQTIRQMNEKGGMDVNLIPGVAETAEVLQKSHQELQEKLVPYTVGQEGAYTAATLRENLGILARSHDRLEEALLESKKIFDKADKESSLKFINNMEAGLKQDTPELQKVADTLRHMLDSKRDEIRALGTGKLDNFIENYFPHFWESPDKVSSIIKQIMGKKPLYGPKSFLKKRTIPTTQEGIDLGFTPVTYNPIDATMLKIREMDRYLMADRTIQALKKQGLVKFVPVGAKAPEGFVKIDDRFADVVSKNEAGELVIRGKYMAQINAARILNNYLSPGLAGKSYIYDLYRGAGNTMNQFQLGLSAFHLGFTSMDATISKFALGINKITSGDFVGGIKEFAKAPFAPVTNILQGRELLEAWNGKDKGFLTNLVADYMASAGGRAKMDKFYATGMKDSMTKALKEGKVVTASMKVPFYMIEQVARPIMEYIVPRQKMGVFMDMMKMEIERNPNASHEQLRGIAQRAWDSVDNRMGQLVYDNLFWHKVTKDLGMASVRSLGWNLGTIREVGGGVKDVFSNVQDVIHGKATKMSYRTAYVMALPIVTGLYGAIYQYLHTGQGPQELKDYFFPKNGGIDKKGMPARVALPTYMKDLYHYTQNPVQTVLNKFSPVNNTIMEMLMNKDFYGIEIRHADDPAMKQVLDEIQFAGTQFIPFGIRNLNKDTRKDSAAKVEPFVGITPAPYDINMTKAEREASEIAKAKIPVGARTKSAAEHSQAKADLRNNYMTDKDEEPLNDAVDKGVITVKEKKAIVKQATMSRLERLTYHLSFEEVSSVLKKATDKERPELESILEKKRVGRMKRGTWTDDNQKTYDEAFNSE